MPGVQKLAIRGFVRQFWRWEEVDVLGSDFVLCYV